MLKQNLTRRRMIVIAAGAAGSAFLTGWPNRARPANPCAGTDRRSARRYRSRSITPTGPRRERLVERCVLEVRRLEQQFSLYRADSAISTLNRTGILVAPDADMVALLKASLRFAGITDGAFDPTVQPLWQLYADHFCVSRDRTATGLRAQKLAEALAKVGHAGLLVGDGPHRAGAARRRHHAERHRAGFRHRPRRRAAARGGPVDDAGRYRRDPRDRRQARGDAVARRSRRSRPAGRRSPKPSTWSIVRSRRRRAPDSGSTLRAALPICSIRRRDAVRSATAR